jgi:hypothetical protein
MTAKWIESPEYNQMKDIVVDVFNSMEWEGLVTPATTTAKKVFRTLAGQTECFVYLVNYNENNWCLEAEFETEGNNTLSTFNGLINKQHQKRGVNLAVSAFIGIITTHINECRMVRLANKQ